ncbi:Aldo/keto reductase [Polyplosphaeria fusca]|uniref:Aldo/keto reductase n=1 Tax=Polyplosphaeria fusca TaxID=682080 RepID=A0A9P4R4R0_9PLEO|nr:Aldo/keto reductase [Polyplosphaeria fusca]
MPDLVGKETGPLGFGMMGLSTRVPKVPLEQSIATMKAALDAGCNFWNAGEFYGPPDYNSMHILAAYFDKHPGDADKIVLSVKGCFDISTFLADATPAGIKRSLDNCFALLGGRKSIDIFECARVDPNVPVEESMQFLDEEYVKKGLIKGIALSEVSAQSIQRAAKVTKIVAVEVEVSLWATHVLENGVAATCGELGIPIIAYSPVGSGILTGQIRSLDDLDPHDGRRFYPKFQHDTFPINLQLVDALKSLANKKQCTPAQLAIAWVMSLSSRPGMPLFVPIPGATTEARVRENAQLHQLTAEELNEIGTILKKFEVVGRRYPESIAIDT